VQVETVAQFGVIFLLFALGLEFSAAKVGLYFSSCSLPSNVFVLSMIQTLL
jgi:Kef-type K+ transport system membrane component KefB